MIESFNSIFSILDKKEDSAILVSFRIWKNWKWIIKLIVYLNKNYISCEIYRKKYKAYNNFVVVALKYSGKNVRRRCLGYAKSYISKSKDPKCIYCDGKLNKQNATTDHIVPISEGGNNSKVNMVVVCGECNAERGNLEFKKYMKLKSNKKDLFI